MMAVLSLREKYLKNGYIVIPNALTKKEVELVRDECRKDVVNVVLKGEYNYTKNETFEVFTNPILRKERGISNDVVWEQGNSRKPIVSKSCGMIEIHFNPYVHRHILFNEKLYNNAVEVYDKKELVHSAGPEKFSIKAKGATDMPKHIDANLWCEESNYKTRIQSLVCLEVDEKIDPRDSGTLELLTNFDKYWYIIGYLTHSKTGIDECKMGYSESRFYTLPSNFDKIVLPSIKYYLCILYSLCNTTVYDEGYINRVKKYYFDVVMFPDNKMHPRVFATCLQAKAIEDQKYLDRLLTDLCITPGDILDPSRYSIHWEIIRLKPGDQIFWSQYIPHRSLRNKSSIPRIVAYYSVFPVDRDWFHTEERRWVNKMFREGKFFYGLNANKYPTSVVNKLEYRYRGDSIVEYYNSELAKKMSGEINWYQQSILKLLNPKPHLVIEEDESIMYIPSFARGKLFQELYSEIKDLVQEQTLTVRYPGGSWTGPVPRLGCFFSNDVDVKYSYSTGLTHENLPFSKAPIVEKLREKVSKFLGVDFNGCLCWLYRGPKDYISWHNDKEAIDNRNTKKCDIDHIASLSFGCTRRFLFRDIHSKKGYRYEFFLSSGDLVYMHNGCQQKYEHSVPKQANTTERINLTFRVFSN